MSAGRERRARGEHSLTWHEGRQRWRAQATVGYDARGKRVYVSRSGTSPSAALVALRRALQDREKGITPQVERYRVEEAVKDWLAFGMTGREPSTIQSFASVAHRHLIPHLGAAKVGDLTVRDVEKWLDHMSQEVGVATLKKARAVLRRSIDRAIAHSLATRNVADHADLPQGRPGRPSRSFTAAQADAILKQTKEHRMYAYIVVSMLTGARTEEMRELTWDHVVLHEHDGVPPHLMLWRSVRRNAETKTAKSRRTVALPRLCVHTLTDHQERQNHERDAAGHRWDTTNTYVFTNTLGGALAVDNVRRDFRRALQDVDGINPTEWTPRELRHTFVSLLSDSGMRLEDISRLVGHSGTSVTELIYRHQIRPVIETGAQVMDHIFGAQRPNAQVTHRSFHPREDT